MLSTHNLRTLKATVSQLPLCTTLNAVVPNYILCSNTAKLRKLVWADSLNGSSNKSLSMAQANALNDYYHQEGHFPQRAVNIPEIIDPELTQVFVPTDVDPVSGKRANISLTPVPSSGLYHEIYHREEEHPFAVLGMHQVEVNQSSWALHGELVSEQKGFLKCFQLPDIQPISDRVVHKTIQKYLVMDFEIADFNVSVGMIGVGLPSLTTIGTFVTNFIQRDAHQINFQIGFALGIHSITKKSPNNFKSLQSVVNGNAVTNRIINMNHTRRISYKATLVLAVEDESNLEKLYEVLAQDFKIAGCPIFNKYLNITSSLPEAYWVKCINNEVSEYLESHPNSDVLDAFLDMYSDEERTILPVASGYALLEPAKMKTNSEILKHAHAFTEATFSAVELIKGQFTPQYVFHRKIVNQGFLHWDH